MRFGVWGWGFGGLGLGWGFRFGVPHLVPSGGVVRVAVFLVYVWLSTTPNIC